MPGAGGGGNGKFVLNGDRVSDLHDEEFWRQTVVVAVQLNHHLKVVKIVNFVLRVFTTIKRIGKNKERKFLCNDFQNIPEPLHRPLPWPESFTEGPQADSTLAMARSVLPL